tara:strand:- start:524 stop:697 length:174 start_codon:yes stop_codon:yes gene_type:complete
MKKLTRTLLLSALGLNFIMLLGIIIFTDVNWNDRWVLVMYVSIAAMVLWVRSGKVQA